MKIRLASGSPRRYELLRQMDWKVQVCPADFDEVKTIAQAAVRTSSAELAELFGAPPGVQVSADPVPDCVREQEGADLVCVYNAWGKGLAAARQQGDEAPVVAADTVVVLDGEILGKPADAADAVRMLEKLSGRDHEVKTGVAVFYKDRFQTAVVTTKVRFRRLTAEEISWYVGTGEPLDKAGGYGIQGKGAIFVESIEGAYDNVVGLPRTCLYRMFSEMGVMLVDLEN